MTESARRLNQTRISSYFSGCVKSVPVMSKKRTSAFRKRTAKKVGSELINLNSSSSLLDEKLLDNIPKRKLPAPIFSDDEGDSENDQRSTDLQNQIQESPKKMKILTLANETACRRTEKYNGTSENLKSASTSASSASHLESPKSRTISERNKDDSDVSTASGSKRITVLESIVIRSPPKTPSKDIASSERKNSTKKETKKINYDQLKVFRDFFVNVQKNSYLNELLRESDRNLLGKFFNMEKNYQYVCIKLFLWKTSWYNIFQFAEQIRLQMEDNEVNVMYNYLKDNGFVQTEYMNEDSFTLLTILNLKDIRDIMRSFRLTNTKGMKETLIAKLLKYCKTQITLSCTKNAEDLLRERIKEKMGFCIKASSDIDRCLYHVYLLNTFTNPNFNDLQEYFRNVNFLNIVFPDYRIEKFHIFYTEQEFSRYADAVLLGLKFQKTLEQKDTLSAFEICKCAFDMLKELHQESGDLLDDSREPHLLHYTANAQYMRIITSGSNHLTTTYFKDVKVWLEYLISQKYNIHKRGDWYCQLALIYTVYLKDYEKAARLVIRALEEEKENLSEVQLHNLALRGKVLNKKTYNVPPLLHDQIASLVPQSCDRIWPQDIVDCKSMKRDEPGRKRLYVHRCENGDTNYLTVEQTALQYYQTMGFPSGEHCEGSLIIALFCLLFWDIIYEKYVKGTFTSNVQNAPLDMYTKYFYINRQHWIKKRLQNIKEKWCEDKLKLKLFQNWNHHSHESSLCQIDAVAAADRLYEVVTCIGRSNLSKIFERLVINFKAYRSGFPDLILWNSKENKAKFVEVKSENDKLSVKQKLWLNYLMDIGVSVAVCHVESKSTKRKV